MADEILTVRFKAEVEPLDFELLMDIPLMPTPLVDLVGYPQRSGQTGLAQDRGGQHTVSFDLPTAYVYNPFGDYAWVNSSAMANLEIIAGPRKAIKEEGGLSRDEWKGPFAQCL